VVQHSSDSHFAWHMCLATKTFEGIDALSNPMLIIMLMFGTALF